MDTKINVIKCFGCDSPYWRNDKKHNLMVVRTILQLCDAKFKAKGHLFLNEVYQELSIPLTKEGQVSGWILDNDHAHDCMWNIWTKDDGYDDVYIRFEALSNILYTLPDEEVDH